MKIANITLKLYYALAFILKFRSIRIAFVLAYYNVTLARTSGARRSKGNILFLRTGNEIPAAGLSRYQVAIKYLFHILNTPGVVAEHCNDQSIMLSVYTVKFRVCSMSNVFAIHEIFSDHIYDVILPERPYIAVDIGMNVGVASLYFASRKEIVAVIGYEPFGQSFSEAENNFALNPNLAAKIKPQNLGVSSVSETRTVSLPESGLLSASTINVVTDSESKQLHNIEIGLVSIDTVFEQANREFPSHPIILKMDCEGEEYQIFERLSTTHHLNSVFVAIVEWHHKGADPLIRVLRAKGFQILSRAADDGKSGLIYAFRG